MGIRTAFDPLGTTGNQRGLPFTFTIDTTKNTANTSDNTFIIPFTAGTYASLSGVNVGISWGDGQVTIIRDGIFNQENCTHEYAEPGVYQIAIKSENDTAPKFNFHDNYKDVNNNPLKLISTKTGIIPQIDINGNEIIIDTFKDTFYTCLNLNSITADLFKNCPNVTSRAFYDTFYSCYALTTIPANLFRYNTKVADMGFYCTFASCFNLKNIPANLFRYNVNVGYMGFARTFDYCTSLTTIPDNIFLYNTEVGENGFWRTFYHCTNLTTIPNNLFYTNTKCTGFGLCFRDCTKLTINPYIFSNYNADPSIKTTRFNRDLTYDFTEMFYRDEFTGVAGTSGTPGDYWTWTYQQTPTGTNCYGGIGNLNITDYESIPPNWGGPAVYRLTINATPNDASISLQATKYTQVDNYIEVHYGTQVTWTVSKTEYITQTNTITVTEDTTLNITLAPVLYTFSLSPTPTDATVTLTSSDPSYIQSGNSIAVPKNTVVTWKVEKPHYISQTNTVTVTETSTLFITLTPETYTFTIVPTPSNATVIINGEERTTIGAVYNTPITYWVHANGYNTVQDTFTIDADITLPIVLEETYYTYTVVPIPADATVIIDGVERTSITVRADTEISISVTKNGYLPYEDTDIVAADITEEIELEKAYRLTINAIPTNATITLSAEDVVQVDNYIETSYGDTITWSVECEDYVTQSGTYVITEDTTWNITLAIKTYKFEIVPTPADATVTLTATGFTQVGNYIEVTKNTTVTWSVERFGYDPQNGTQFIGTEDVTLPIVLEGNTYVDVEDYTYIETTSGVTITKYVGSGNSIIAPHLEVEEH